MSEPCGVVVVFDGEDGSAARKRTDQNYKANRPTGDQGLEPIRALPDIERGVGAHGIGWLELDDAEVDDLIATLVHATSGLRRARSFSTLQAAVWWSPLACVDGAKAPDRIFWNVRGPGC
nr:hypothetical protein [Actinomadura sp. NBRC 104425]